MGLLDKVFGHRKQRTMYDDFLEAATPIVVTGYRRIAARRGCAPGPSVSDAEIIAIYQKVGTAFQDAARARGEILPSAILNNIVLIFFQKYQTIGKSNPAFFDEHIAYEAAKFQNEGLRNEYQRELSLFDEPPLWHRRLAPELHYTDPALIDQLDAIRCEFGLDHDLFYMALMQTRNMTHRSVLLAYRTAKRTAPNLREIDYLALTIADRATKKMVALPFNSSPTAWTAEQLQKIIDQAETMAETCKDINGVCHLAVQMEEYEGTFTDPLGVISRIDKLFTEYGRRSSGTPRNA